MNQEPVQLPHKLTLNERSSLTLTGVSQVVRFEESCVVLETQLGTLVIHGKDLELKTLSIEGGQGAGKGHICAMIYQEPRQRGGVLRRLVK